MTQVSSTDNNDNVVQRLLAYQASVSFEIAADLNDWARGEQLQSMTLDMEKGSSTLPYFELQLKAQDHPVTIESGIEVGTTPAMRSTYTLSDVFQVMLKHYSTPEHCHGRQLAVILLRHFYRNGWQVIRYNEVGGSWRVCLALWQADAPIPYYHTLTVCYPS